MTMPSLDLLFAWTIAILAGAACIGALAVVLVAEWYAIRRTIERHRQPAQLDPSTRYWRERSAVTVPERES
jgi:O-antigen ligase